MFRAKLINNCKISTINLQKEVVIRMNFLIKLAYICNMKRQKTFNTVFSNKWGLLFLQKRLIEKSDGAFAQLYSWLTIINFINFCVLLLIPFFKPEYLHFTAIAFGVILFLSLVLSIRDFFTDLRTKKKLDLSTLLAILFFIFIGIIALYYLLH